MKKNIKFDNNYTIDNFLSDYEHVLLVVNPKNNVTFSVWRLKNFDGFLNKPKYILLPFNHMLKNIQGKYKIFDSIIDILTDYEEYGENENINVCLTDDDIKLINLIKISKNC